VLVAGCSGSVKSGTSHAFDSDAGATGGSNRGQGAGGRGGVSRATGGFVANGGATIAAGGLGPGGTFVANGGVTIEAGGVGIDASLGVTGGSTGDGDAGGSGGIDGGSAGQTCEMTTDSASILISGYGVAFDGGSRSDEVMVQGRVATSTPTDMAVDACPAFADCAPMITNISVFAPGVDLSRAVPSGSLVSVHYSNFCQAGCSPGQPAPGDAVTDLAVTSLDTWGGFTNPTPARSGLYLAVDDGGGSLPEFPFTVQQMLLIDCITSPSHGACSGQAGLYSLIFRDSLGKSVELRMGVRGTHALAGGALSVQNLRSFVSGGTFPYLVCNRNANFAYWVANAWE